MELVILEPLSPQSFRRLIEPIESKVSPAAVILERNEVER